MATAARRKPLSEDRLVPEDTSIGVSLVALDRLDLADKNVRRGGQAELEQLAADIEAHGVLQNLVAIEFEGRHLVVAGGRRLRALQLLKRQGKIPADHPVPVRLCTAEEAREISLAENFQRLSMGAAEEAEAFARLLGEGLEEAAIAQRFGLSVLHVRQRLRLAELAPAVLDALKAGRITLDVAKAFAAVPDQARQAQLLKATARNSWFLSNPDAVRREMLLGGYPASHAICRFVGEADYRAAGGRVEGDLFTEASEAIWADKALAERLARAKLAGLAEALRAEHGFARVIPLLWWTDLKDAVEGLLRYEWPGEEAAFELPADVRAQLVVTLDLEHDDAPDGPGWRVELDGDRAWLNDASVPVPVGPQDPDGEEDDGEEGEKFGEDLEDSAGSEAAPEPEPKKLPQVLRDALAMRKRDALALALLEDVAAARDVTLFLVCELALKVGHQFPDLGTALAMPYPGVADPVANPPWQGEGADALTTALADRAVSGPPREEGAPASFSDANFERVPLDDSWRHLKSVADRFAAFVELPSEERAHWAALALGRSLQAHGGAALKDAIARHLMLRGVSPALWRPTADNYFDRAGKAGCLAFLEAVFDGRLETTTWAKWKKADLVIACEALAAGDSEKLGGLGGADPATIEAAGRLWMPAELQFGGEA